MGFVNKFSFWKFLPCVRTKLAQLEILRGRTTSWAKTYEFGQKPTHFVEYDALGSGSTYGSSLYGNFMTSENSAFRNKGGVSVCMHYYALLVNENQKFSYNVINGKKLVVVFNDFFFGKPSIGSLQSQKADLNNLNRIFAFFEVIWKLTARVPRNLERCERVCPN